MFELSKCSFGCWVWLFTCQFAGWEGGSSEFRFRLFFNPRAPSIKRENVVLPSYFHFDISTACGAGESNTQSINLSSLLFMIPFSQIILEHGTYYNTFKCQAFILIQGIKSPKVYWDVGALSSVNLEIYLHVCTLSTTIELREISVHFYFIVITVDYGTWCFWCCRNLYLVRYWML